MAKMRADVLLVQRGLFESRAQAQAAILAGAVRVGADRVVKNAGEPWDEATEFTVLAANPYVSRAAAKLLPALDAHLPRLDGLVALDVGASTGGFTDLMLQRGAAKVYAVDVGHGQLHYRLRQDPRVVALEGVNARFLGTAEVPQPVDVLTADVSFISLRLVLPPAAKLLRPGAWAFTLVKPQFEAGRAEVGKGGVVRSDAVRARVATELQEFCRATLGWTVVAAYDSPITGPKGNRETVAVFRAPE